MPVWQKAMDIAEKCFNISEPLPRKEDLQKVFQPI